MARRSARDLWAAKLAGRSTGGTSALPASLTGEPFRGLILGIDPSLRGTGLAIVNARGGTHLTLLASETLKLSTKFSSTQCLGRIADAVRVMLESHPVEHVAVEETIYVQNFRTAQILGAARGAAIGMAAMRGHPIFEYPPLRVKQAVAGYGRASKEQVAKQMQALLRQADPLPFDESDAAAVAICHALTWRGPVAG